MNEHPKTEVYSRTAQRKMYRLENRLPIQQLFLFDPLCPVGKKMVFGKSFFDKNLRQLTGWEFFGDQKSIGEIRLGVG